MNKKDLDNIHLKQFLEEKKSRGVPSIVYMLNSEQLDFVENVLNHKTIPFIYTIYTKKLVYKDIRNKGGILLEVYRAQKNSKSKFHRTLTHSEKKLLDEHDIPYAPFKHFILLK